MSYYTYGDTLVPNTVARSADLKAEFEAIETGLGTLPTEAELKLGTVQYGTDAGSANAYVVTLPYTPAAYTAGMVVRFIADNDNTGASTVNVNAKGVKSIKRPDGTALGAGDIDSSGMTTLVYNGTDFILTDAIPAIITQAAAQVTLAQAQASAAASSASTASTQATNASNSASAAAGSASAAASSYDSFDDRYLGAKAADPSTDNDGNALVTGAIYWNTASNLFRVWSGSAWSNAIQGALSATGGELSGSIDMNNNSITEIKLATFNAEYDNGNSGTSKTISFSNGQKQKVTLTDAATLTLSFTSCGPGLYQLKLIQDSGGTNAVTWSGISSTNWVGQASAPVINGAANGVTIVNFWYDGTTVYGAISRVGMA